MGACHKQAKSLIYSGMKSMSSTTKPRKPQRDDPLSPEWVGRESCTRDKMYGSPICRKPDADTKTWEECLTCRDCGHEWLPPEDDE